jgi:hypothetical protein
MVQTGAPARLVDTDPRTNTSRTAGTTKMRENTTFIMLSFSRLNVQNDNSANDGGYMLPLYLGV